MITNIKDTPYFALYGEIYRLHGKYLEPVADDSFWSALIEHPEKYYKGNVTVSCNGLSEREDNK